MLELIVSDGVFCIDGAIEDKYAKRLGTLVRAEPTKDFVLKFEFEGRLYGSFQLAKLAHNIASSRVGEALDVLGQLISGGNSKIIVPLFEIIQLASNPDENEQYTNLIIERSFGSDHKVDIDYQYEVYENLPDVHTKVDVEALEVLCAKLITSYGDARLREYNAISEKVFSLLSSLETLNSDQLPTLVNQLQTSKIVVSDCLFQQEFILDSLLYNAPFEVVQIFSEQLLRKYLDNVYNSLDDKEGSCECSQKGIGQITSLFGTLEAQFSIEEHAKLFHSFLGIWEGYSQRSSELKLADLLSFDALVTLYKGEKSEVVSHIHSKIARDVTSSDHDEAMLRGKLEDLYELYAEHLPCASYSSMLDVYTDPTFKAAGEVTPLVDPV